MQEANQANELKAAPYTRRVHHWAETYLRSKAPIARKIHINFSDIWDASMNDGYIRMSIPSQIDPFTKEEFNPLNYNWRFAGAGITLMIYLVDGVGKQAKQLILALTRDNTSDFLLINPSTTRVEWNSVAGC